MVTEAEDTTAKAPLSRERVLRAAVAVADDGGLDALTMRHLAESLGVEAMSLYYHVANKEAILDGVVEMIVEEITEEVASVDLPDPKEDWRRALRERVLAARRVMLRHPWAPPVFETRTKMSMATIKYFDEVLATLIEGGCSYDLAHHAMHALGSRALGFTQELFVPDDAAKGDEEESLAALQQMATEIPYVATMMSEIVHDGVDNLGWCDDQTEFEFGLDLLLDGLERRLAG